MTPPVPTVNRGLRLVWHLDLWANSPSSRTMPIWLSLRCSGMTWPEAVAHPPATRNPPSPLRHLRERIGTQILRLWLHAAIGRLTAARQSHVWRGCQGRWRLCPKPFTTTIRVRPRGEHPLPSCGCPPGPSQVNKQAAPLWPPCRCGAPPSIRGPRSRVRSVGADASHPLDRRASRKMHSRSGDIVKGKRTFSPRWAER